MGSRWFRRTFVFLVLFVISWILRINIYNAGSGEVVTASTNKLYNLYQEDREILFKEYGGKTVEVTGYLLDVVGDHYVTKVYLTDYKNKAGNKSLIECSLTGRRLTRSRFEDAYEIALQGKLCKNQDDELLKMEKCELVLLY